MTDKAVFTNDTTVPSGRYSRASIALHWLMLILIAVVYACMELRGYFPRGSALRVGMKTWHFMLGLSVLVLVVVRIGFRLTSAAPPILPAPVRWQAILGKVMHLALYALMIGMPIFGWLILSAEGKAIPFFFFDLPALVEASKPFAHWAEDLHKTGATIGYFLIGLHAAAALFHHYVVRDNTLRRMLPKFR